MLQEAAKASQVNSLRSYPLSTARNSFGHEIQRLDRLQVEAAEMLQTKMSPSSTVLRPYVWAYGMTTGGSTPSRSLSRCRHDRSNS
jgi:hypothetical protein